MMGAHRGPRKALRYIVVGGLASTVLLAAFGIAALGIAGQVAGRIAVAIDPRALGRAIHDGMAMTIREGDVEEKLSLIAAPGSAAPDEIEPYAPLLEEAVWDEEADVSVAVRKALERINAARP